MTAHNTHNTHDTQTPMPIRIMVACNICTHRFLVPCNGMDRTNALCAECSLVMAFGPLLSTTPCGELYDVECGSPCDECDGHACRCCECGTRDELARSNGRLICVSCLDAEHELDKRNRQHAIDMNHQVYGDVYDSCICTNRDDAGLVCPACDDDDMPLYVDWTARDKDCAWCEFEGRTECTCPNGPIPF